MERVLLARHGETEWNVASRRQGQLDSPLTSVGRRDAVEIATMLRGVGCDVICSSPLGRAHATASVIAERLALKLVVINDLREIDMGGLSGLTNDEIESEHPGVLARRDADKYRWRFPGGESYADAEQRVADALASVRDLAASLPLIVSHAMISRVLLRSLLNLDSESAMEFSLAHRTVLDVRPSGQPQLRSISGH